MTASPHRHRAITANPPRGWADGTTSVAAGRSDSLPAVGGALRATKRVNHPLDDDRTCDGISTWSQPDSVQVIADPLNRSTRVCCQRDAVMNKPILMPQLSATRTRTGMRSIGELMSLLIKQYELQDQLRAKQQAAGRARRGAAPQSAPSPTGEATAAFRNSRTSQGVAKPVQATFSWFETPAADAVGV
ncbi:MAG: hypothetical protein ACK48X_09840 [Planctomycetota bacterium]